MIWDVFLLVSGLALLTAGAESLVRGSASIAVRLGLKPLIIGLTIVAFGTSAPELVVSLGASLNNQSDISIGNVIGSNIFNVGIILGITSLLCPVKVGLQIIRRDGPIMVGVSVLAALLVAGGTISRPAGMVLFAGLIAYIVVTVRQARKSVPADVLLEFQNGVPSRSKSVYWDILFISVGLLLLVSGSRLLVISATDIARSFGISEAVISLTIIAAGTSMPELFTSVVAALRRQPDIAVGNVIGSNIFNILGILGLSSIAGPLTARGITATDLCVMVAFSIILLPLMHTGNKIQRWEGLLLLIGYGTYLSLLWP